MKFVLILFAALILGGAYYYTQSSTPSAEDMGMTEDEHATMDDHSDHEDMDDVDEVEVEGAGSVDMGMPVPAPGNEGVDEMIVEGDVEGAVDDSVAEKTFEVSGHNFAFDMSEIRVSEGDTVTINFTSTDGFHDWVVDEFSAATEKVQTGGKTSVTFVADKAGTFEYYCSVGQHRANGMVGTLIVE